MEQCAESRPRVIAPTRVLVKGCIAHRRIGAPGRVGDKCKHTRRGVVRPGRIRLHRTIAGCCVTASSSGSRKSKESYRGTHGTRRILEYQCAVLADVPREV